MLALLLASCDQRVICDDAEGAQRGIDAVREVYDWTRYADVLCRPLDDANRTCRTDSATLEGCAPFPGRAIVVEGADTCRVVVHEGAHWLDATCAHDAPCWPVEAEIAGKALCDSP